MHVRALKRQIILTYTTERLCTYSLFRARASQLLLRRALAVGFLGLLLLLLLLLLAGRGRGGRWLIAYVENKPDMAGPTG